VQAQPEREEYVVCYKGELWRIIERDPREPMCDIRGVNVRTGDTAWGGSHSVTTATPARIVAELRAGDKIIDGNCEYRIAQIVAGGATEDEVGFLSTRTLTDLVARPGVTISWQQEREP
jgi:hypothetical protein